MSNTLQNIFLELQDPDPEVRELALDKIGAMNPENARELILPYLSDDDPKLRETAACNLGEIQDPKAVPDLVNAARTDPDQSVRYYAFDALSEYHTPEILSLLLEKAYHGSRERKIRLTVTKQLAQYDTEEAVEALLTLLQTDDRYVLTAVASSLLTLNCPRLQLIWEEMLLTSFHPYLCQIAAQALGELLNVKPLLVVLPFLASRDTAVRSGAAFALGFIDDECAIDYLIELGRQDASQNVREMAIMALARYDSCVIRDYLIDALSSQSLSARAIESMAEQLSEYDSEKSVDALLWLLDAKRENEVIHATAIYSLYKLNRPRLRGLWKQILEQYDSDSDEYELAKQALAELEPLVFDKQAEAWPRPLAQLIR